MTRSASIVFLLCGVIFPMLAGCGGAREADPAVTMRVSIISDGSVQARVEQLVAMGPRPATNAEVSQRAREVILSEMNRYGYYETEEMFDAWGTGQVNLIFEKTGVKEPDRILEIGAHYDSVTGSPGADDNASGVAGVLEIARCLAGIETQRTLRFCFFAAEEMDLNGSREHVARLDAEINREVEGIIVLEMIGYATDAPDSQKLPPGAPRIPVLFNPPTTGNFLAVIGNFSSGGLGILVEDAARSYVPELKIYSANRIGGLFKDSARSDHFPYWQNGRKGIMLSDTSEFRNPNYHLPSDTPDTLNYPFLRGVAQATAAAAYEWAGVVKYGDENESE